MTNLNDFITAADSILHGHLAATGSLFLEPVHFAIEWEGKSYDVDYAFDTDIQLWTMFSYDESSALPA